MKLRREISDAMSEFAAEGDEALAVAARLELEKPFRIDRGLVSGCGRGR